MEKLIYELVCFINPEEDSRAIVATSEIFSQIKILMLQLNTLKLSFKNVCINFIITKHNYSERNYLKKV